MRRPQHLAAFLLALGALALAIPAATLAAGGGSAGDNQYTDPFAHSGGGASSTTKATSTTSASTSTSVAAPATTPATTVSGSGLASSATPTATTASTLSHRASSLPYTGYDGWVAGALGVALFAAGLSLRRTTRRA